MKTLLCAALLLLPFAAAAEERAMISKTTDCSMTEQVNVNISFNFQVASSAQAKAKFDAKLAEIENFVKQAKLKKWSLQSMNYSVSANGGYDMGEATYNLSGSASYNTDNADQAFALMEQLSKQKLSVSVSVNKYRNSGNCD